MQADQISVKAKLRTPYHNKDGRRVPSVTTINALLDKSKFLVPWAWKLGIQGIDYKKHRDDLADVGTLAHELLISVILGIRDRTIYPVDTYEFTPFQVERANRCLDSGLAWLQEKYIEPILVEHKLISEIYQFGGRFDFFGYVDKELTLADFKTGKAAYDSYFEQLAGYAIGLEEDEKFLTLNQPIKKFMIVNIPRSEGEQFQVRVKRNIDKEKELFLICRRGYELKRLLAQHN